MSKYCGVQTCDVNNENVQEIAVSFFELPTNTAQRLRWLQAMGGSCTSQYVCSLHFTSDQLLLHLGKQILIETAVPNMLLPEKCGPFELKVCQICLAADVKIYNLQNGLLNIYMDYIAKYNKPNAEFAPRYLCYICARQLKKYHSLLQKSNLAQAMLMELLEHDTEVLKDPNEKSNENLNLSHTLFCENVTYKNMFEYVYDEEKSISYLTSRGNENSLKSSEVNYIIKEELTEYNKGTVKVDLKLESDDESDMEYVNTLANVETVGLVEDPIDLEFDDREDGINKSGLKARVSNDTEKCAKYNNKRQKDSNIQVSDDSSISSNSNLSDTASDSSLEIRNTSKKKNLKNKHHIAKRKATKCSLKTKSYYTAEEFEIAENKLREFFDISKLNTEEAKYMWSKDPSVNKTATFACEICFKDCTNFKTYLSHICRHTSTFGKEVCPVCQFRFQTDHDLQLHLDTSHLRCFTCKICGENITDIILAKRHRSVCDYKKCSNNVQVNLENIVKPRSNVTTFKCNQCGESFRNRTQLSQHSKQHLGSRSVDTSPDRSIADYADNFDTVDTPDTQQLAEADVNDTMLPKPEVSYVCRECGDTCPTLSQLYVHMDSVHPTLEKTSILDNMEQSDHKEGLLFIEGKVTNIRLKMDEHKKEPQKKRKHKPQCHKCKKTFPNREEMLSHKIAEHKIVPRCLKPKKPSPEPNPFPKKCEYCDVILKTRRENWFHIRKRHRNEMSSYKQIVNVICDTCGRGFQNAASLRVHELRHKPPSVRCPKCPRLFYDNALLNSHMRVHDNARPYQCAHCGMAFNCKSNLHRHTRTHSEEIHYSCEICGRGFKQRDSYTFHWKHVHMKMPYPKRDRARPKIKKHDEKQET